MKFEGEHLFPGQVGHFFVLLAFVASLISAIAYFKATSVSLENEKRSWILFARGAFFIQFASLLIVFITIYYYIEYIIIKLFHYLHLQVPTRAWTAYYI